MSRTSRARRSLNWTAIAVVVLAGLWTAYRSAQRLAEAAPEVATNRALLIVLTLAIVILALGFVGVLIRNLVRLILGRKGFNVIGANGGIEGLETVRRLRP